MYFSAIIPTLNRPNDLIKSVTSVLKQKVLPYELIIVDQSKNDKSYNLVTKLYEKVKRKPILNYCHDLKISGLLEAKQKGVQLSNGDVVCFLEDDIVLHPNYFANSARTFRENSQILGCCGITSNLNTKYMYEILFKLFHRGIFYDPRVDALKYKDCRGRGVLISSKYLSGGISCYRKEIFDNISFDMVNDFFMLEDIEFSTRAADFFGSNHFFINTSMCLVHNMSPTNRTRLAERWQRKLREYITFYKKNSKKPFSLINLIVLLIGLFGESIISSILINNIGPIKGTIVGTYLGFKTKLIIN